MKDIDLNEYRVDSMISGKSMKIEGFIVQERKSKVISS